MMAARMPVFISPVAELIRPTKVGPPLQPRSPASASMANMAVPPRGRLAVAVLKVPGQRMPTENQQRAQPKRLRSGDASAPAIM